MESGTVSKVIADRGFGFITSPGGPDVFFHMSALQGLEFDEQLVELRVEFDTELHKGKLRARAVWAAK